MSKTLLSGLMLISLLGVPTGAYAEDLDDDEDLEYFFSIRQKSTIDNFPLKEIAGDELSGAAIEGALQANTSNAIQAKPIYMEEQEESDKEQSGKSVKENEEQKLKDIFNLSNIQAPSPQQFQQPIYTQPTGRTYSEHHTNTVLRP